MAENRPQNRANENKLERIPVDGMRDVMTVLNKEPGWVYRWVEDTDEAGSRIWKFKRAGYELASLEGVEGRGIIVGEEAVYKTKQDGAICRLHTGEGRYSYLMRIKQEWYEKDQSDKQARIDDMEAGIVGDRDQGDDSGTYGSISIGKGAQTRKTSNSP